MLDSKCNKGRIKISVSMESKVLFFGKKHRQQDGCVVREDKNGLDRNGKNLKSGKNIFPARTGNGQRVKFMHFGGKNLIEKKFETNIFVVQT